MSQVSRLRSLNLQANRPLYIRAWLRRTAIAFLFFLFFFKSVEYISKQFSESFKHFQTYSFEDLEIDCWTIEEGKGRIFFENEK